MKVTTNLYFLRSRQRKYIFCNGKAHTGWLRGLDQEFYHLCRFSKYGVYSIPPSPGNILHVFPSTARMFSTTVWKSTTAALIKAQQRIMHRSNCHHPRRQDPPSHGYHSHKPITISYSRGNNAFCIVGTMF